MSSQTTTTLMQSINQGLLRVMSKYPKSSPQRVLNTPICEQAIAGFAIGSALGGVKTIAEIQFADYMHPAFDQITNELAKYRYRSGGKQPLETVIIRTPYGAVGHGGLYHSQSPEGHYCIPGLRLFVPSNAKTAEAIMDVAMEMSDPCIIFEPKVLYRQPGIVVCSLLVDQTEYGAPASVLSPHCVQIGNQITMVAWGSMLRVCYNYCLTEASNSIELFDLPCVHPIDFTPIVESVKKTGRLIVVSEAPFSANIAHQIASFVQGNALEFMKAPVQTVCGWDTPFPLVFEPFYMCQRARIRDSVDKVLAF